MSFLDKNNLQALTPADFNAARPFPWANPHAVIGDAAFHRLRNHLPGVEQFARRYNIRRRYGQMPHDRYTLEYHAKCKVHPCWHEFIAELRSSVYSEWIAALFNTRRFFLTFHWHYATRGCQVSPHCDNPRKLGSHIFYFNSAEDWREDWGGQTLILDDAGRFPRESAPDFEDFAGESSSRTLGNYSLLFGRRGNSWHGVRPLKCPEGEMRKVFIVVINRPTLKAHAKHWLARWKMG